MRALFIAAVVLVSGAGCADPENYFLVLAGPVDVTSFEARDEAGDVVWRIESPVGIELKAIVYGVVPQGFSQSVPAAALPPRKLVYGEPLTLTTVTGKRFFVHRGWAVGEAGFDLGTWEAVLRDGATGPASESGEHE